MKKRSHKTQNIFTLVLTIAIIVAVNFVSSYLFTRFDLTADKRYTLSETTKKILGNLKDLVFFKVYLEGDFPPDYKRMRNATKELLDEMRINANGNLEYEFIDPSASEEEEQRNALYKQLSQKGLYPTSIETLDKEGSKQQFVFPGAIITYKENDHALSLLKDQMQASQENMINNSIRSMEYNIINEIKKITTIIPPQIAFLKGHGELDKFQTADIYQTLSSYCGTARIEIAGQLDALKNINTLIIAKPDSAFDERDKFVIDQFLMNGGNILWLIDQMDASMDSLANHDETFASGLQLNLDDMLFHYGIRINYDLVADMQAMPIPIKTGNYQGSQPEIKNLPWAYFPLIFPISEHPVVNNLNAIKTEFVSSIDTVTASGITKTILLTSSQKARKIQSPVRISLEMLRRKPDYREFRNQFVPMAVLLEGNFTSNFKNRIPPALAQNPDFGFKEISKPTRMIVISDGDVIKNDYRKSSGKVTPLGYDRYSNQFFGNKDLILNMIDYLNDNEGLVSLRSKQIKLRLLDKNLVDANKGTLQLVNVSLPVIMILFFGIIKMYIRRKKYAA